MIGHVFKTVLVSALLAGSVVSLSACDTAKEQLGLTRRTPDEFAVVKRAPLEIPPNLNTALPPPTPGAPRPQEKTAVAQARSAVIGSDVATFSDPSVEIYSSAGEEALLSRAGPADPDIRNKVNAESAQVNEDNRPVAQRLLNIGKDEQPAVIVDAPAEARRIIDNKAAGAPVTQGETPTIDD